VTDQMFANPVTSPPLRPAERVGRWVLHRAGISNVWQYDHVELQFAGGRALLRGRNGAGKSKALEVLLPFLLDGDTRGIDAAGRDRTSVYWLMTDGRDPGNHVGYVWLELRMTSPDGDERFCTLGAGLKASTSTRQPATWFFLTEEARVGVDLHLDTEMSAERLRERFGSDAVTTATEHRRRVAAHLFELHDPGRYANLLHLLHRLRDPNIGNKIEAGELASVLSDALPPPSDEALEKAAERFDTLDQVKVQLERTQRTATALAKFLDTYAGYARTVLRQRAGRLVEADGERRRAERQAKRAAEAAAAAQAAREAADAEVGRLRHEETAAVRTLEGLQASEAYKQHQNLADRRGRVEAKEQAARSAEDAATGLESAARQAADDHGRALARWEAAEKQVQIARAGLVTLAREAAVDPAVVPDDAGGIAVAVAVADGRRRAAHQVRGLAVSAAGARDHAGRADERAARSEQELVHRQAEADEAAEAWVTASRSWRTAVRAWPAIDLEAPAGAIPDWETLHRLLGPGGAGDEELEAVPQAARALLAPLTETARGAEGRARSALDLAQRSLQEKEAERDALEGVEEATPPASRFLQAERDRRSGAPFYELVDVAPDTAESDRAGLEAALEASGLLDAWVAHDGIVVHPATEDVILGGDAPVVPDGVPTLADALVAQHPHVARLLRTVALGEQDRHPWVALDGRWSLGPIHGAWRKGRSEYLGAAARRATRERQLADLALQCDDLRAAVEMADRQWHQAQAWRQLLDRLPATLPGDAEVRQSASTARARAAVAGDARARHDNDRRSAEQARTAAARATSELAHAAGLESLPTALEALDVIARAAGDLARELQAWQRLWEEGTARATEVAEADERQRQRTEAAASARRRAADQRREHDEEAAALAALEEAVGATVAEVLDAIAAWTQRRDAAQRGFPEASRRAQELARAEGQAAEGATAAAAVVVTAAELVCSEGEKLTRVGVLPGVSEAAGGGEWEWDATDMAAAGRALLSRIPDGEPVSDQVVLNRLRELEDGLAGGYDVVFGEEDGVKFFHVVDDTGRQPLPAVAARVGAEAAAAAERLAASEREVIERFLLGELGEELRERLLEAHDLVQAANRALSPVRTSHGIGAHLDWRVDAEESTVSRRIVELLVRAPRSVDEDAELRDALMDLIRTQREKEPALGYLEHLRQSLDYRRWHRFTVQVVDEGRPGSVRTLSQRLGLSQGEQRVLSYLALFAAASAHYDGLGAGCPRLLLLDDAFAKVDEPTHGRLLKLLIDLDLDFMLTSERMWGCYADVPSLEIYEALREPTAPGVALVHYRWDGQQRHLVGL
jgi:uncharacterized protein (TIGR02680 family)